MSSSAQAALVEWLAKLAANGGGPAYIADDELHRWPPDLVAALGAARMLARASPARSAVCPGCERACAMPVEVLPDDGSGAVAFIVCDKRSDINRVEVQLDALTRWKTSGESLADGLAQLLRFEGRLRHADAVGRWPIGVLVGKQHKDRLTLFVDDGAMKLAVAGHEVNLEEVISFGARSLRIDQAQLVRLVDHPTGAVAAGSESAADRQKRLQALVAAEKKRNPRVFLKAVADLEGISVYALKQVIYRTPKPADPMEAMTSALAGPVSKKVKNKR